MITIALYFTIRLKERIASAIWMPSTKTVVTGWCLFVQRPILQSRIWLLISLAATSISQRSKTLNHDRNWRCRLVLLLLLSALFLIRHCCLMIDGDGQLCVKICSRYLYSNCLSEAWKPYSKSQHEHSKQWATMWYSIAFVLCNLSVCKMALNVLGKQQ